MKKRRGEYTFDHTPADELAEEYIEALSEVKIARRKLKEAIEKQKTLQKGLIYMLQHGKHKKAYANLIEFSVSKEGTLVKHMNLVEKSKER